MSDTRKEREVAFHNQRYENDTRTLEHNNGEGVGKYYSVTHCNLAFFWKLLRAGCRGKSVLEYGCGTGSWAPYLVKQGAKVTGIDISEVAVQKARREAAERGTQDLETFEVMDAESMTFPIDSFDRICGTGILHHLDLERAYSEVARVLKPDGQALFTEPLGHNPVINFYRRLTPSIRTVDEHPLMVKDIELARRYFGRVETHYFHIVSLLATPFRRFSGFNYLVRALNTIDRCMFKLVPFLRRYAWVVVLVLERPKKGVPVESSRDGKPEAASR